MPPVRPLGKPRDPTELQVKVTHSEHALEFSVVVAQPSDGIPTRHGLSLPNKNLPDVTIERDQGFAVLVGPMIDGNCWTPAFFDVCFQYRAVGYGNHGLS